jgi:hypothetical protein
VARRRSAGDHLGTAGPKCGRSAHPPRPRSTGRQDVGRAGWLPASAPNLARSAGVGNGCTRTCADSSTVPFVLAWSHCYSGTVVRRPACRSYALRATASSACSRVLVPGTRLEAVTSASVAVSRKGLPYSRLQLTCICATRQDPNNFFVSPARIIVTITGPISLIARLRLLAPLGATSRDGTSHVA